MIHYELILLYNIGFSPSEVIRLFGYSRGTAYRFHKIFHLARKQAINCLLRRISVSPAREQKAKNLDALRSKKSVSPKEKWEWEISPNGTTKARKKKSEV